MKGDLQDLRDRIEQVSEQVVQLLNERFELSLAIGRLKRASGKVYRDPDRERELIARLIEKSSGSMPHETLELVFRTILDASVARMEAESNEER